MTVPSAAIANLDNPQVGAIALSVAPCLLMHAI
jgi:hypothetical protein